MHDIFTLLRVYSEFHQTHLGLPYIKLKCQPIVNILSKEYPIQLDFHIYSMVDIYCSDGVSAENGDRQ